jgi:tetrahydromethanopterin S-methyltransferase subunit F
MVTDSTMFSSEQMPRHICFMEEPQFQPVHRSRLPGTFSRVCQFAGDVNHDGFADVIIGAPQNAAYLILGASSTDSPYSVETVNSRTIKYTPEGTGTNYFASSVAGVGDVNNDEFDDFVICDSFQTSKAGVCYLIYGGNNLHSMDMSNLGTGGIKLSGSTSNQQFGFAVCRAGDINNDGFADFLVGNGDFKNMFLFYGGSSLTDSTTTLGAFSGVIFPSPKSGDFSAFASAGDFNNDGFDDLMISLPSFSVHCTIWVVYGGSSLPATCDLNGLTASTGVRYFTNKGDQGGISIAGGGVDFNKDGFDDIIIGAPSANKNQRGVAHIIFGSASPVDSSVFQLSNTERISLNASLATSNAFGSTVALTKDVVGTNSRGIVVTAAPTSGRNTVFYLQDLVKSPTASPSASPSVSPTFAPSDSPSMTPTVVPSVVPTLVPTSFPTFGPTQTPSAFPTESPTVTHTPTLIPSVEPTITPTWVPSVDPTMVPSFRPSAPTYSPSAVPTPVPTWRSKSSVVINAGFTMNSVNGESLTSTSQETIKQSIANASQATVNNVDLVSVTRTNRRLLSSVGHRVLSTVSLFSYKVVAEIHFNLIDFPGLNESYVAGTKSKVLMQSMESHEFDRIISYYATINNAVQLANNVSVSEVSVSTTVIPVSRDSENDSGLSNGQLAGLVIGVTLGAILLGGIGYLSVLKIRSEKSSNYRQVPGTSEGEIAVDILKVYEERNDNKRELSGNLVLSKGHSEVKI